MGSFRVFVYIENVGYIFIRTQPPRTIPQLSFRAAVFLLYRVVKYNEKKVLGEVGAASPFI